MEQLILKLHVGLVQPVGLVAIFDIDVGYVLGKGLAEVQPTTGITCAAVENRAARTVERVAAAVGYPLDEKVVDVVFVDSNVVC